MEQPPDDAGEFDKSIVDARFTELVGELEVDELTQSWDQFNETRQQVHDDIACSAAQIAGKARGLVSKEEEPIHIVVSDISKSLVPLAENILAQDESEKAKLDYLAEVLISDTNQRLELYYELIEDQAEDVNLNLVDDEWAEGIIDKMQQDGATPSEQSRSLGEIYRYITDTELRQFLYILDDIYNGSN